MINIKELSIGNWIKNTNGNIGKVIGITEQGLVVMRYHENSICYSEPALLEGILLTPEILKKNGWNEDAHCFPEDENYDVELWKEKNQIFWTINWCEYNIAKINYVHQLQNILTLYGIDKEIKLL